MSDDHGYQDLGCYGSPDIISPNLDKLARQGVRFTDFYVTHPVCTASRAAFLTGRYPDRFGLKGLAPRGHDTVPHDEKLLPEFLKTRGYKTAAIGKWHLGYTSGGTPEERGFDEFYGLLEGVATYRTHLYHGKEPALFDGKEVVHREGEYLTEIFTDKAVEFISANMKKPFFLYLAYNAPHYPMHVPPQKYLDPYGFEPDQVNNNRLKYMTMVTAMDHGIGEVLDALERNGVSDNTLVIFFSDNGGQNDVGGRNTPYRGEKHTDWEGGIRVPAIVRWPGKITGPKVCREPVMSMDFFELICKAAHVKLPKNITFDTHDSSGLFLDGRKGEPRRDFFFRYGSKRFRGNAMRRDDFKLVSDSTSDTQNALYNLSQNPSESSDVSKQHPELTVEMIRAMEAWSKTIESEYWAKRRAKRK
ncbi:Arylsulfatase [Pontiella sulfatireligans]|uniref:Arylsulfatase n=2 Tax=Pontiella sulfatireligans TaxID=2750658 RepID=A0A6C2USV9_9BACT|nr:sulfatase S1_38 [Kiritimatiellales bacterium]VGO21986.1 Arylsulfatase [Pontiella sulfatireligans]